MDTPTPIAVNNTVLALNVYKCTLTCQTERATFITLTTPGSLAVNYLSAGMGCDGGEGNAVSRADILYILPKVSTLKYAKFRV